MRTPKHLLLFLFLVMCGVVMAQPTQPSHVTYVSAAPSGACNQSSNLRFVYTATDPALAWYGCLGPFVAGVGAWQAIGGTSSGGTVTSVIIAGTANQVTVSGTCTITTTGTCTISLPAGIILGTDNSAAGTLRLANGSSNAHTIWSSGATTTNTIAGFTAVPTTGHLVTCTVSSTTCTLTDGGAVPAGTVTSVAETFTGGLISVAGSPITSSGTLALTVAGTSGGIPYFSGTTTWASSALGVTGAMVAWGGAGNAPTSPLSLLVTNQNALGETWTWYNSTATTGKTLLHVRGGAGNSSNDVLFSVATNGDTNIFTVADNAIMQTFYGMQDINNAYSYQVTGIFVKSAYHIGFTSGSAYTNTVDADFGRYGVNAFGLSSNQTTLCATSATNCIDLYVRDLYAAGAAPTRASGQFGTGTTSTITGRDEAGKITIGTGGASSGTITYGVTKTNAPSCEAHNETSGIFLNVVPTATNMLISGVMTAADVVSWMCRPFVP